MPVLWKLEDEFYFSTSWTACVDFFYDYVFYEQNKQKRIFLDGR